MALSFWIINVGYGDALYAEAPMGGGRTFRMLMDGGSAHQHANVAALLDERGVDSLDLMVSTHLHEDHVAGLSLVAGRLKALGEFWCLCPAPDTAVDVMSDPAWGYYTRKNGESLNAWRALWQEHLPRLGCRILTASGGDLYPGYGRHFSMGLHLEVLHTGGARTGETVTALERVYAEPERLHEHVRAIDEMANEACLAFRLRSGAVSALLPGDNLVGWWRSVPPEQLRADLLKLSHHGAADGTSADLVSLVQPSVAVVSVGLDRTDRPEPQTLQALGDVPLYRSETARGHRYVKVSWHHDQMEVEHG